MSESTIIALYKYGLNYTCSSSKPPGRGRLPTSDENTRNYSPHIQHVPSRPVMQYHKNRNIGGNAQQCDLHQNQRNTSTYLLCVSTRQWILYVFQHPWPKPTEVVQSVAGFQYRTQESPNARPSISVCPPSVTFRKRRQVTPSRPSDRCEHHHPTANKRQLCHTMPVA